MGWSACFRKCTRCLGSRGGDADGWSVSASTLCIPLQPHFSKALPRFSGDVYTYVVGAKNWQLFANMRQVPSLCVSQVDTPFDLLTQYPVFCHEIRMAQQSFLIDASRNIRQQCLPIHALFTLRLCYLYGRRGWVRVKLKTSQSTGD